MQLSEMKLRRDKARTLREMLEHDKAMRDALGREIGLAMLARAEARLNEAMKGNDNGTQ